MLDVFHSRADHTELKVGSVVTQTFDDLYREGQTFTLPLLADETHHTTIYRHGMIARVAPLVTPGTTGGVSLCLCSG